MNDKDRWRAVVSRDPAYDGTFVFCVVTTMSYCRPVCKARLAQRYNVLFCDSAAEAEAAGYRSCKRCKPQMASYTPEADKIRKACALLHALPSNAPMPGLARLAQEAGLTKHHFHRLFKRETGLTPREYALASRIASRNGSAGSGALTPVTPIDAESSIVSQVGVELDTETMSQQAMKGMKAAPYMDDHVSSMLFYHTVETTYGVLLIVFNDGHICNLELGTDEAELLASLESSFPSVRYFHPAIELVGPDENLEIHSRINAIVEALENPTGKWIDVPGFFELNSQGVWDGTGHQVMV